MRRLRELNADKVPTIVLEVIFRRETVEEILTYVYDKSCILEYYKSKLGYQAVSNLQKLKDISRNLINKENMQPLQFLDYLYIMLSTSQEEDEVYIAECERQNGVIRLYSIHKAKWLCEIDNGKFLSQYRRLN